jgi:hypothetical protein
VLRRARGRAPQDRASLFSLVACRLAGDGGIAGTEGFAPASKHVTPEAVAAQITCGPSPERHLEAIRRYIDAGYDHIILVQVGPEQAKFVDFFGRELSPVLRRDGSTPLPPRY